MGSTCFVPGCVSGYKKKRRLNKQLGIRNEALFSAPKDDMLLEKWRRAIPRKDKVLLPKDKVCELHFEEECIMWSFDTLLKNGEKCSIKRAIPLLKTGSIPSKFPSCASYLSKKKTFKRKAPADRLDLSEKKICRIANENADILAEDEMTYFDLLEEISDVTVPEKWLYHKTENCLLFLKLNADFHCERHVVINEDLSIRVFIDNKEMNSLIPQMNITNSGSITEILGYVDDLIICKGLHSWKEKCMGFIEGNVSDADRNLCQACANDTKIEVKQKHQLLRTYQKKKSK